MKGRAVYILNRVDIEEDGKLSIHMCYLYSNRQLAEKMCASANKHNRINAYVRGYPKLQHMFDGYARKDKTKKAAWFYVRKDTIK